MTFARDPSAFDMFQWLPPDVAKDFVRAAQRRRYAPGELIYSQGEPGERMFRILSGAVRLSVARSDGRELLYLLFGPGDCFGASSLVDHESRPQSAEAGDDLEVLVLGKNAFERIRATHRSFDDALLRLTSRHMRLLSGLLADAHLDDISARVATRILAAAASFGTATPDGIGLSINLSQAELGLMVGASRQTVNRVMQKFQQEGSVAVTKGRLIIHSLDDLRLHTRRF